MKNRLKRYADTLMAKGCEFSQMKNMPEKNADIVAQAQEIIDNFANIYTPKSGIYSALPVILWAVAGALAVLTLSLYFILK